MAAAICAARAVPSFFFLRSRIYVQPQKRRRRSQGRRLLRSHGLNSLNSS